MPENLTDDMKNELTHLLSRILLAVRNADSLPVANALGYMAHNVPGILTGGNSFQYFTEMEAPRWLDDQYIPDDIKRILHRICELVTKGNYHEI